MKTIWKYPLEINDYQTIEMPKGSECLSVQNQGGGPCLWALIPNTEAPKEPVEIRIVGTGHPINPAEKLEFIDTFQTLNGIFIFHAFRKRN